MKEKKRVKYKLIICIVFVAIFFNSIGYGATWKKIITSGSSGTAGTALLVSQCPTGYIVVPKNTDYTPVDFCVMKYEAKNDGYGMPASTTISTPWVSIDRLTARAACQALGAGYDMISNEQWQTIARNIAGVATNWDNGIVGNAQLNRGHSDGAPASSLAASTDTDACSGTVQACSDTVWDSQRRTHVLSNGNVIWDFAGNIAELVTNNNTAVVSTDIYASTYSGTTQTKYGSAAGTLCATPSTGPYCGMGYGGLNYSAGAVVRGGRWIGQLQSGVFTVSLLSATSTTALNMGFRCVFVP